jgi:hypothetical protein
MHIYEYIYVIYIYIYMYINISIHIYIYIYMYIHIYAYIYIDIYLYTCTVYRQVHVHLYVYLHSNLIDSYASHDCVINRTQLYMYTYISIFVFYTSSFLCLTNIYVVSYIYVYLYICEYIFSTSCLLYMTQKWSAFGIVNNVSERYLQIILQVKILRYVIFTSLFSLNGLKMTWMNVHKIVRNISGFLRSVNYWSFLDGLRRKKILWGYFLSCIANEDYCSSLTLEEVQSSCYLFAWTLLHEVFSFIPIFISLICMF